MTTTRAPIDGAHLVAAVRLAQADVGEEVCSVITEDSLTIDVEGIGTYTLMWTPTAARARPMAYTAEDGLLGEDAMSEPLALALGFLFTEGVIAGLADVRAAAFCPDNHRVVRVHLADPNKTQIRRRDVVVNSSCGVCGAGGEIDSLVADLPAVGEGMVVGADELRRLMAGMRAHQTVFDATGGAHAAAVFTAAGEIVAVAEDLGRHNALDKVIGRCLMDGIDTAACGVLLSSRLSLEMVTKAIRARFQVVAAVSAPTSLAIQAAELKGLTLCGFVRDSRCTVFAGRRRIAELRDGERWMH